MSEMNFEQMIDASFKTIHTGEVVEGTVIDVKPDEAVINIGYKADGILTRNEYTNESGVDMTTMLSVGDTMERGRLLSLIRDWQWIAGISELRKHLTTGKC